MTVNEDLLNASVRHQVGIQRLSNGVVRKIITLLARVDEDIVAKLLKYDPTTVSKTFSQRRLEKLLEAVREVNKEAYSALRNELNTELRSLAAYEAEFQERMIKRAIPIRWDIVKPSASQLYAAVQARPFEGRFLKEWFSDLTTVAQKRVREAIQQGFVEGEGIDQMVRRIRGTRALNYRDGILDINRRSAQMVVRTAVNHTSNVARSELYKANSGLIKGVRWVSTLDGRTSKVCISRDGNVYEVDKGPRPPAHPNCRSSTMPVLKSWKELGIRLNEAPAGTRASMDGQVPDRLTYGEWLRMQPAGFQDEVLGKKKGRLFRKGGLTVDRFVDRRGNELTLDELRVKEAEAWEKAGID